MIKWFLNISRFNAYIKVIELRRPATKMDKPEADLFMLKIDGGKSSILTDFL